MPTAIRSKRAPRTQRDVKQLRLSCPISLSRLFNTIAVREFDGDDYDRRASTPTAGPTYLRSVVAISLPIPSQEDLNYLWKLGAGSIVGAAAIKSGSVLFPEITIPNLLEAIIIISSPVIVAVLLMSSDQAKSPPAITKI
ncbi:hypothetical protein Vadar_007614 [Vaccinium darrowii]|uniref:Uncharacterized protein n=1 Tax=Vaccinium darrowii TaxID=229202 RepID=A0ACB7YVV2_9ERIC|nr:hypothetical protein Vadar_007614 [Vaccinium darrowii]